MSTTTCDPASAFVALAETLTLTDPDGDRHVVYASDEPHLTLVEMDFAPAAFRGFYPGDLTVAELGDYSPYPTVEEACVALVDSAFVSGHSEAEVVEIARSRPWNARVTDMAVRLSDGDTDDSDHFEVVHVRAVQLAGSPGPRPAGGAPR